MGTARFVLREGTNGFTCMPGNPRIIGDPPMCADAAARQWSADFKARKPKPTNTEPGIVYMLAGATQRSDTDPYDMTSQPIAIGPHWMIMWPFDPKTAGLPTTHKASLTYGELDGQSTTRLERVDMTLRGASFDAAISNQIVADMWQKWVQLAATGAITCLLRGNIGEIVAVPGGTGLSLSALRECVAIAKAGGYPQPEQRRKPDQDS